MVLNLVQNSGHVFQSHGGGSVRGINRLQQVVECSPVLALLTSVNSPMHRRSGVASMVSMAADAASGRNCVLNQNAIVTWRCLGGLNSQPTCKTKNNGWFS